MIVSLAYGMSFIYTPQRQTLVSFLFVCEINKISRGVCLVSTEKIEYYIGTLFVDNIVINIYFIFIKFLLRIYIFYPPPTPLSLNMSAQPRKYVSS